jgi:hypothetical protein
MKEYAKYKERTGVKKPCHILGMTASIVKESCQRDKFVRLKHELEELVDCKVITTENLACVLK